MANEIIYSALILDDEELVLQALARGLKKRGFITWTTSDQEAAIKFVRAHHPSVACIDLHMPKMNGVEVIKQMREISPNIRVVVVSAFLPQFAKLLEPFHVRVVEKGTRTNQELEDVLCEELELSKQAFEAIKSRGKTRLKAKILIVEEERDIADFLKEIAIEEGFEVESVYSANEAFAKLEVFKPDILFSDFRMPGTNGDELIRKLKASPDFSCIKYYVGMTGESANNLKFLAVGASEVLNKPFDATEFIAAIKRGLESVSK